MGHTALPGSHVTVTLAHEGATKEVHLVSRLGQHIRHNAVAYVALFVALGGTSAYAANEWTGANIKDETLTGADVKGRPGVDWTLTGQDIKNSSVLMPDIGNGQVTESKLASPGAFIRPTFQGGWSDFGGGWALVGYRKDRAGAGLP
jgi:hypothetical protein